MLGGEHRCLAKSFQCQLARLQAGNSFQAVSVEWCRRRCMFGQNPDLFQLMSKQPFLAPPLTLLQLQHQRMNLSDVGRGKEGRENPLVHVPGQRSDGLVGLGFPFSGFTRHASQS